MTSLNTYFNAIGPIAKTIKKNATKLTDVVDETLKKTQNIGKHIKTSESELQPHLWRSSTVNPFGEIIIIPAPVPIITPVISLLPEPSIIQTKIPEQTIHRKKSRRQRTKNGDSENYIERKQQINLCLDYIINEIIDKENIELCLNQLIDIIIVMDNLIENISFNTISIEDNSMVSINTNEDNSMVSINTNEDNSELSEIQSNTIETNLYNSINRMDISSIEQPDPCESTNFTIKSSQEHICEPSIQQTDTTSSNQMDIIHTMIDISDLLNPPVINTQKDSLVNCSSLSSDMIESPIYEFPQTPIVKMIEKKKRYPIVNCYSIPSGTIISHMSCSSTYIYICTNQKLLFYAKLPSNDLNLPLQWNRYFEPAERLIVSITNQTIWRVFNKCLYSSNDPNKSPPLGNRWNTMKFSIGQSLLSISINDQCGWYIKEDGTLWLIRLDDENQQSLNVTCPFNLNNVVCSVDKIGVTTNDSQILIRIGCTNDCPEGDGWIFIEHKFGPFDDFTLITNNNMICIIDKKHRLWINEWSLNKKFYEILCNDNSLLKFNHRYLMNINDELLCFTDCQQQIYIFSDCLTGNRWSLVQKDTRLQCLIGAFTNEKYVWALTTDGIICSSNGQILEKPRQAQYLTHATFVPDMTSQGTILWSLDESCNIYVRNSVEEYSQWEQLDQSQFDWSRRLVDIVCNSVGVWAVDDKGCIYFRHGHISNSREDSSLNPAWISIPGEPECHRTFAQIFCGPEDWMVYATDNKQTVYARIDINENNFIGTSWKIIEDCSALELAISEHTLWLLTSHGRIQCRENISLANPIGTRSTILPGRFYSITVSVDDNQVWALSPQRHLYKLNRLSVQFEK